MYLQSGNRTGVLVPNPINGNYVVEVTGKTTGPFTLSSSILDIGKSNNFTNPIFHESVINDSVNIGTSKTYGITFSDNSVSPSNKPPDCTHAIPSTATLWPPDNKMKTIKIHYCF